MGKSSKKKVEDEKRANASDEEEEEEGLAISDVEMDDDANSSEESEAQDSESGEEEDEDDEEDDNGEGGEEERKKRQKRAETRRRVTASRRGHRKIATLGGYSSKYASSNAALDVNAPIVTLGEVIKAAKWCPGMATKAAFEGIDEFERRVQIAQESLPPTAAKVLQANAEHFLRRLTVGVVTRQADASLARASAAMVAAELRPLRKVLQFSFAQPHGLLRYAQTDASGVRLNTYEGDTAKMEDEKELHKEQAKRKKEIVAEHASNKEKKKNLTAAADKGPKKKIAKDAKNKGK